jgi:hypothetical protein
MIIHVLLCWDGRWAVCLAASVTTGAYWIMPVQAESHLSTAGLDEPPISEGVPSVVGRCSGNAWWPRPSELCETNLFILRTRGINWAFARFIRGF